jgi:hypothetical protein
LPRVKVSVQVRSLVKCFVTSLRFYCEDVLLPRLTPKLEYGPCNLPATVLLAMYWQLPSICGVLHPQPEGALCCADRKDAVCNFSSLTAKPLRAGRSEDRIPFGAMFSAPVQTGPGTHPSSYSMGTWSLSWVKRPGCGVDHSSYLAQRLKKALSYNSTPRLGVRGLL